jgi:GNAT superfamily N-acetyltransferase
MLPTIRVIEEDDPAEREAILQPLIAYNLKSAPDPKYQLLGLLLKDEYDATIGGLWGRSAYEWLFVELLFVPEPLRGTGTGTRLLQQAENIARQRNCTGVWLDTFAFQALGFYQKLGYTVFGELKDHPRGISQYWLQKRVAPAAQPDPR